MPWGLENHVLISLYTELQTPLGAVEATTESEAVGRDLVTVFELEELTCKLLIVFVYCLVILC